MNQTTMDVIRLQRKFLTHQSSMLREGFLNDQFSRLQNETGPFVVEELITMFYDQSENHLNAMSQALEQKHVDFKQLDYDLVHPFKGSSVSIGAARLANICIKFRNFCEDQNLEGCRKCLQQLQHECSELKNRLQYLFKLQKEIHAAGGSIPTMK